MVSNGKATEGLVQQGIAKSGAESPDFNICASIPQKPFFICFEKCKLANKKNGFANCVANFSFCASISPPSAIPEPLAEIIT